MTWQDWLQSLFPDAYVVSMFDCLDGPDQVAMDLSNPAVAERLRQDMAKRDL